MAKKDTLFDKLVKTARKNNDFAFKMNEENPYEVKEWIDSGCYVLNAMLSDGDMFKGFPAGKRITMSGAESTGKSLLTILMIKMYLKSKPNAKAIFFESEGSSTVDMARKAKIPEESMIILPVSTVEETRNQMVQLLDMINDTKYGYTRTKSEKTKKIVRTKIKDFKPVPEDEQEHFIFVLDSLGMLGTEKETEDAGNSKNTVDMTKAKMIKSFARVVSLKLSMSQCPFVIVNHIYASLDQYKPPVESGGSGVAYMKDVSLLINKKKQKDGTEHIGSLLQLTAGKSRFMQEGKSVVVALNFKKGINKYSYLYDLANELKVFKKDGYSWILADGTKATMKSIRENQSKYFKNEQNLQAVRDAVYENFTFGGDTFMDDIDDEMEDSDDSIIMEDDKDEIME